jgi:hypothetical protein
MLADLSRGPGWEASGSKQEITILGMASMGSLEAATRFVEGF